MTFQIGFSQVPFDPPLGKAMGGYSPLRHATGNADPLFAKTVCVQNSGERTAIILTTYDLVAVDQLLKEKILEKVQPSFPGWKLTLFLFATHTHSGPAGTLETRNGPKAGMQSIFGDTDEEILLICAEAGAASIREALGNTETFTYGLSSLELEGVGTDRNDPAKEGDHQLTIFSFTTASGRHLLLWHFACHPTILKGDNTLYSADLPGRVATYLPEFDMVLFLNGNCGNISTRFTRQGDSFAEVDRFGKLVAAAIRSALPQETRVLEEIRLSQHESSLQANPLSPFLKKQGEILARWSILWWDRHPILLAPAELTSELTKSIRKQHRALFFCYCDDYLFYFADQDCFRANTYEAQSSLIAEAEAERLMQEMVSALKH